MDCSRTKTVRKRERCIASILRESWQHLRLSVQYPELVPTWDAIVVTASSSKQARLYSLHLHRAMKLGRIASSTVIMAAPDPNGVRIGSGAATLGAIEKLAVHYSCKALDSCTSENDAKSMSDFVKDKHILLIHAGGDSKRVPWATSIGKAFIPLPFLASEDPDGPAPLLFDHILAIASCARQALRNEGGIMIMTGDVLPCFDASEMILPDDSSCIITAPITVDIAANHGVVVASKSYSVSESHPLFLVDNLLQKPKYSELISNNAVLKGGRTLLDTGVIAVRGRAWANLASLACSSSSLMITHLISTSNEMGLYEELVASWVPARHDWLRTRPMGKTLLEYLGTDKLHTFCAYDLKFLHLGTSVEVLDHFSEASSELIERRHLSIIPGNDKSDISPSAVIISSVIGNGVSVGEDSLIFQSILNSGTQIGSFSIVFNFEDYPLDKFGIKPRFVLPPRHCLWNVCIDDPNEGIIVVCGLYDNPKLPFPNGTFCGRPWKIFFQDTEVEERDLWEEGEKCLWNARLFPVLPLKDMLKLVSWLLGYSEYDHLDQWRDSRRLSMETIHKLADFERMDKESRFLHANIAGNISEACISGGFMSRNLSKLGEMVLGTGETESIGICRHFIDSCELVLRDPRVIVPKSRVYQLQHDLVNMVDSNASASLLEPEIWSAVGKETADAVRFLESPRVDVALSYCMDAVTVELPVRVDFAGGWSDTPPWSLERTGCVLNMAIKLEGRLPIGVLIETTKERVLELNDDAGNHAELSLEAYSSVIDRDDPFKLVKSALHVTNMGTKESKGLKIRTWAHVPRGSGLGTSSILAAAVLKGLLLISGRDSSDGNVANLVLVLEQLMGTGGGWQDQIGGLYPGIKFTRSFPGVPLRLQVTPLTASPALVKELEERLLVVFTGQVREGREVVEKVVRGYLRREKAVVDGIKRAAELARQGREAVIEGNVDALGAVMRDTWTIHQRLYPSVNPQIDRLFAMAAPHCCGYKLLGAGAGGFGLFLANDSHSASVLSSLLVDSPFTLYPWTFHR